MAMQIMAQQHTMPNNASTNTSGNNTSHTRQGQLSKTMFHDFLGVKKSPDSPVGLTPKAAESPSASTSPGASSGGGHGLISTTSDLGYAFRSIYLQKLISLMREGSPQSKMVGNSHDDDPEQQYSLDLQENDKFFSRLMAKETSAPNSSCRVLYYRRASSAVPFTWESQPGTPKHTAISESSFIPAPQITPLLIPITALIPSPTP